MGSITSRQNAGVEEVDIGVNHAYRYPPKSGNYFSSHFIMGGERFDTAQPEMYLFGENMDVNFLGSRPAPFPYPAPTANEPSKTLKALINIRKESIRFVRAPDESATLKEPEDTTTASKFNIEFTFDCDVRCAITIMYFCSEEVTTSGMIYTPRDPSMNSETYHYKRGANQQFSQVCHIFDPSLYPEEELLYSFDREILPIVIYCVAEEGEDPRQSHATFAVVEKHSDGYVLKPLKQKLFVDGLSYLLQEIYGIENKNADNCKVSTEEDTEDNGAECVICMCDLRDTLILPCRHLCLCNCCADSLRYQANNCPICRAPFRALLQIKALQKMSGSCNNPQPNPEGEKPSFVIVSILSAASEGEEEDEGLHDFCCLGGDNIPPGYEAVSLIEALNGPSVAPLQPTAPPAHDLYVQVPQNASDAPAESQIRSDVSRCFIESMTVRSGTGSVEDSTTQTERPPSSCESNNSSAVVTEMRMSVLLAQESEELGSSKVKSAVTNAVPSAKKKPVDPAETRSLLDEDSSDLDARVKDNCRLSCQNPQDVEKHLKELRAPQAEAEVDDDVEEEEKGMKEDGEDKQRNQSIVVLADSTITESEENDVPEVISHSPVVTPRKNPRSGRSVTSSDVSVPASPSGAALNLTHQSDSVSLPGTPLSNASAVSRSSDASVSSASSTRALLSHPMDGSPASVV
ncbi:probable E3 ubiquitin-protein ligase MGRN1 isoform X3 [Panulirus ornatus]|uniref:probable E3 ubiquitin-protein ligase MGRN1 isoform X3 n=1 Tax=Panulirus ornatus TaxID=150431 RepID=UPI003A89CEDD